eukprot:7185416-Alexandrium_andersonii.AAC.1
MQLHEFFNGLSRGLCPQVLIPRRIVPCHGCPNASKSDRPPRAKPCTLVGAGVPVLLATAVLRRAG